MDKQYTYKYAHPAVTTDAVLFGFDGSSLNVLLIERGLDPYKGKWALPGGFLNPDFNETAEECVKRELKEETNVDLSYLEQFHTFSAVNRDPRERVITIAYFALVRMSDYEVVGGDDAARAKWFPLTEIPALAFDHDHILRVAVERLRRSIHFEPIGFHLLDEKFTMPQLQNIYEAILGVRFDRRNFHKKMLALGYIQDTGERKTGSAHRSPVLYSFDEQKYTEAKKLGMRLEF